MICEPTRLSPSIGMCDLGPEIPKGRLLSALAEAESGVISPELSRHIDRALKHASLDPACGRESAAASAAARRHGSSIRVGRSIEDAVWSGAASTLGMQIGLSFSLAEWVAANLPVIEKPTLFALIKQLVANFPLLQSDGRLQLVIEGEAAVLEYQYVNGLDSRRRQLVELMMAALLGYLRVLLPKQFWPTNAWFPHLRGADQAQAEKQFGLPVSFGVLRFAALSFPRDALHQLCSLPGHARQAKVRMQEVEERYQPLIPRVAFLTRRHAAQHASGIAVVAKELGLSRATLARRLSALDLKFSDLTCYLRLTTAQYYLCETDIRLNDLASLLSYSEQSSLTRAFLQLTGMTPLEYRRLSRIRGHDAEAAYLPPFLPGRATTNSHRL